MGTPKVKVKDLGTPQKGYQKNVAINYPLDDEHRVEIGGALLERLVFTLDLIQDSNCEIVKQLDLLNKRYAETWESDYEEDELDDDN